MTKKETALLDEIKTTINKYEKEKAAKKKEKQTIQQDKSLTVDDLIKFINAQQKPVGNIQQTPQPMPMTPMQPQQPPSNKQQIAFQLWRDSKATTVVCLIAIVLPMISILIAMIPDGGMYALIITMIGIIYPCLVLVKMVSLQTKLHHKYGFKPLLQFRQPIQYQQQPPYQQNKKPPQKEDVLL